MDEIKIEKGVPIPKIKGHAKYPWNEMEVGDSFFAPLNGRDFGQFRNSISTSARQHKLGTTKNFRTATVDGGVRVWRIA